MKRGRLLTTLTIALFLIGIALNASATLVTNEDFETGAFGWNNNLTTDGGTTFTKFLGRHGGSNGTQILYKDFTLPGDQTEVTISFSFYEIDSWDGDDPTYGGNESFYIYVDGVLLRQDLYQHGIEDAPVGTVDLFGGASSPDTNYGFEPSWSDQGIGYSFTYATTDTNLRLGFGANLNQSIWDESWGIDNVLISSNGISETPVSYDVTIELNDTTGKDASVNWDCYNLGGYRDVNYNDAALYTSGCNSWMSGNSLLKFNLDTIPSNANITSARLILTHWENGIRGYNYHYLHQYMCEWEEDSITYNISASCPIGPRIASQYMSYYNKDFNQPIPSWLVQGWVDGSINNYGVSITHSGWGWHYYCSSEFDDPAERPKLIISYELETIDAAVDIRPGSCPNPFNMKSQGVLPVAILGTEDLDVTEIDITSIRLNGVVPLRSCIEDVSSPVLEKLNECDCISEGPDGTEDLTLKFDTQEIVEAIGTVEDVEGLVLQLTGSLSDGTPIEGSDCISLRPKQKKQK